MYIRIMKISDYAAVIHLWKSTSGIGLNEIDDSRAGIEKFLFRNSNTCFVAEDNGEVIGTILCGHDGRRALIYHMAVAEQLRRNGIGKTMLEAVIEALKQEGIQKISLVAMRSNNLGNAFWERMGFIERPDLVYRNRSV